MIKFFQKLKAKKGFTLVELIVVIAIIGVLAAILVPTMLGYVTSSRVTSADTTAAKIEDTIDTFLTQADTSGYGMLQSNNALALVTGNCAGGTWTVTVTDQGSGSFKSNSSVSWSGTAGTGSANATKVGVGNAAALLAIELGNLFPDTETCTFEAYLRGGDCTAVWYTADSSTAAPSGLTSGANISLGEWTADTFAWDNTTAGVASEGFIVGTSPKLNLG